MRLKEVRSILEEFNPQFPLSKGEKTRYYLWRKMYHKLKTEHHRRLSEKHRRLSEGYKRRTQNDEKAYSSLFPDRKP